MEVFPELITGRLKLRKISIEDIPSLVKYANNKKIADKILNNKLNNKYFFANSIKNK